MLSCFALLWSFPTYLFDGARMNDVIDLRSNGVDICQQQNSRIAKGKVSKFAGSSDGNIDT